MFAKTDEIAEIFGITPARVGQLVKEGFPKAARNKYDIGDCVDWWINRAEQRAEDRGTSLDEERRKLYQAQRIRTDLDNQRTQGNLIPAEDVQIAINELAAIYAGQLDAIGGRLAHEVAGMTEPAEILDLLTREARAIRETVAIKLDALADTLNSGDDSPAAA